ncbi:MAG: aldo/keto reductase [Acidobacteria bacterium]|nr:aldo/keto reductase [Acidobacteriota bacterium]
MLNKRRLGRTGLEVSEISLGCVEIGIEYGIPVAGEPRRPAEAEAERLLHTALDLGINHLDTARAYGDSEAIIGRVLSGRREEFILTTKIPVHKQQDLPTADLKQHCRESLETSLRALRTDRIDVLLLHTAGPEILKREDLGELLSEAGAGRVRSFGASVYGLESARVAIASEWCECVQIAYSILDRRPAVDVLDLAGARDVGVVARSVLLKGALTWRYRNLPDELEPLRQAVEEVAEIAGGVQALPELAYRYVLSDRGIQTALVGASSAEEVEQAVAFAARGPLDDDQLARIRAITLADPAVLDPSSWTLS